MKIWKLLAVVLILSFSITAQAKKSISENEKRMSKLLLGEWKTVDFTFHPQDLVSVSKEMKIIASMMPVYEVRFRPNKKLSIKATQTVDGKDVINQVSLFWRLENQGDYLIFYKNNKEVELHKVLLIGDEMMETLVESENLQVIYHWERK